MSVLLMVIWGFVGWFSLGIEKAGVLGDAMSPISALITAFALGAALYSLDVQRKAFETHKSEQEKLREQSTEAEKFDRFIHRLEQLDSQHHISAQCPWCDLLEKAKQK